MKKESFDIVTHLQEKISEYTSRFNEKPSHLIVSTPAFSWLLAIFAEDERILGASPIDQLTWTYNTEDVQMRIVIDEMMRDFDIVLA